MTAKQYVKNILDNNLQQGQENIKNNMGKYTYVYNEKLSVLYWLNKRADKGKITIYNCKK